MISEAQGVWGLFASSFIASTLLPGGSEALLAWLVSEGQHATWQLVSIATLGNTLGGWLTFATGIGLAIWRPQWQLLKPSQVKARRWLDSGGPWLLLLSWLPIIGDPLCLAAGWLRLPVWLSLVCILLGKFIRYLLVAGVFSVFAG